MELGDPQNDLPGRYKTGQIRRICIDYSEKKDDILKRIDSLNERLKQDLNDTANSKAELIYAGLAPIPFLFYAGSVISNRKKCSMVLEWDRHSGRWHEPSQPQQDLSFAVENPAGLVNEDLAIAMPLSVEFSREPIDKVLNEAPVMWLKLPGGASQDSLSSKLDQQILAKEFYNILAGLRRNYPKIKRVHLFVAAQASFVFYLGQQYSSTVHPPLYLYGFNASQNRYNWRLSISEYARSEDL